MKDGKLDRDDIGKKFRHSAWLVTPGCEYRWFCLLGFEPERGFAVGYCNIRSAICFRNDNGWKPYEESPKKTIRMAPALVKRDNIISITNTLYQSDSDARRYVGFYFIQWPASEALFVDVPVEE